MEGALFASALVFCLGTLGLDALFVNSRIDQASRYVAVAYLVSEVVVLTVLITAFRQTIAGIRPVFLLLLGAFAISLVSDSAFAYMELGSQYGSVGSVLDVGWVAGYILLGLAALWPVRPGEAAGGQQVRIWQLGLPWIAMLMVIATVAYPGANAQERLVRMRTGELAQVDVDGEMRTADGRTLWVHRSVTPLVGTEGRVDHYLVMFDDVTEEHNAAQASLANLAALENLSRLKSEVMSMVSHAVR